MKIVKSCFSARSAVQFKTSLAMKNMFNSPHTSKAEGILPSAQSVDKLKNSAESALGVFLGFGARRTANTRCNFA